MAISSTSRNGRNRYARLGRALDLGIFAVLSLSYLGVLGAEADEPANGSSPRTHGSSPVSPAGAMSEFPWGSEWTWEQLESFVAERNPASAGSLQRLRGMISQAQARVLFRHLVSLPSLSQAAGAADWSAIDRRTARTIAARDAIRTAMDGFAPRNDVGGMIDVAERLAAARKSVADWFVPDPQGRRYSASTRIAATPSSPPGVVGAPLRIAAPAPRPAARPTGIRIHFDLSPARRLLDGLSAGNTPDQTWESLVDQPVFRELLAHRGEGRLRREQLVEWWRRAQNPSPLNRIYEWVHPGSYYDFGGVAVNADAYREVVAEIERSQSDMTERVGRRLAMYLPANLKMEATVQFLFAAEVDGWATNDGLGINLEHFGDDYDYLERIIAHECYHRAQIVAMLPSLRTVAAIGSQADADRLLREELLDSVWREGSASFIGSYRTDPPTKAELDADFQTFHKICDTLYGRIPAGPDGDFRDQIARALQMSGPLYRVGWRMTSVIDAKQGCGGVAESQMLGPALFFARYIETYRKATLEEIPETQRFRPDVEAAILRSGEASDARSLAYIAHLIQLPAGPNVRKAALAFAAAHGSRPRSALALVLLGEHFASKLKDAAVARKLLVPGVRMLGAGDNRIVLREAKALFQIGASKEAVELLKAGVAVAPSDPGRLYYLGEAYRSVGQTKDARTAFRRALVLDASFDRARRALAELDEELPRTTALR